MHLLITGGLGYVGSYLAERLRQEPGMQVTLLARHRRPEMEAWRGATPLIEADVTLPETLRGCCDGVDAVLHLAALNEVESERHPQQALRVNTLGTWNLLEESRRAGVSTFLYFSTFHVYGPGHTVIDENSATRPVSHYAATHRMAELFVGLPSGQQRGIILRLSNGYGAPVHPAVNRWTLVVNDLCRQAVVDGRLVLKTPGTQARDFLAFPDLFAATWLLLSSPVEAGVYNVGGEHSVSIRGVAARVQAVWQEISGAQVSLEAPAPSADDRPVPMRFSIERLKALGYRPAGDPSAQMDQMIRETLRLCEKLG